MRLSAFAVASLLAVGATSLFAVPFTPYSNVNNPITTSTPVTYTGANGLSGGIIAYFYSVSASDTDTISVYDATTHSFLSPTGAFNNQSSSTPGSSIVFDSASLQNGDLLYFDLYNASYSGDVFSSSTSISSDGENHAYITPFNGTIGAFGNIVGTYVGMEDLPNPHLRLGLQRRHLRLRQRQPEGPEEPTCSHPRTQHLRSAWHRSPWSCRHDSSQIRPLTRCQISRRILPPRSHSPALSALLCPSLPHPLCSQLPSHLH